MEPHGRLDVPLSGVETLFGVATIVALIAIVMLVNWWLGSSRRRRGR